MAGFGQVLFVLFPLVAAFAAASDFLTMTISNKISIALVIGFVLIFPFTGADLQTLGLHLAAGALVLAITFGCFALGWIGGGDAKFAAAVSLWLGLGNVFDFILISAIFGGVLTLAIIAFRKRVVLPVFTVGQTWLERLHDPRSGIPYGIALAASAIMIYPHTMWIRLAAQ